MRVLALALIASLLIALPAASAGSGVHKCYGADAARACVDYFAINDFCVRVFSNGEMLHEECVIFIGPPP